jgi:hypothetical protein
MKNNNHYEGKSMFYKILNIFEKQAKKDPLMELESKLFFLTYHFTIEDWKNIRTKEFYKNMELIQDEWERKKYLINEVKAYLQGRP